MVCGGQGGGFNALQAMRGTLRYGYSDGMQRIRPVGRRIDQRVCQQQAVGKLGHLARALARPVQLDQCGGKHVDVDHPAMQVVELDHIANFVGLHHRHVQVAVHAHHQLFADDQDGTRHSSHRQRKTRNRRCPHRHNDQQRRKPDDVARPHQVQASLFGRHFAARQVAAP